MIALNVALALALTGAPLDIPGLTGALEKAGAHQEVIDAVRESKRVSLGNLALDSPDMGYTNQGAPCRPVSASASLSASRRR